MGIKMYNTVYLGKATPGSGGGGDQHNLGYYATLSDLQTAHVTANAGDFAVVGATDTVWIWDTDTSAWVDSDQKGQVTSGNNQTGAVTVQETLVSGTNIKTINGTSLLGSGNITTEAIQVDTMPTASADELGKVYQFIGTTGTYTHGYFYECVSDGQNPATYSWEQTNVQPTPSGLPSQTGQNGKFLTTDGTDASWSDKPLVNKATNNSSIQITTDSLTTNINGADNVIIGKRYSYGTGVIYNVAIGTGTAIIPAYVCLLSALMPLCGSQYDYCTS